MSEPKQMKFFETEERFAGKRKRRARERSGFLFKFLRKKEDEKISQLTWNFMKYPFDPWNE